MTTNLEWLQSLEPHELKAWFDSPHGTTRWERLWGTPQRTAEFFVRNCCCDCYACHVPEDAPCFGSFGADESDVPKLTEWMEEEG